MSFNKSKAMQNAERYLTQGKIQAAIGEYKVIVENDPKDINTMNMLGDLYTKSKDTQSARNCYQQVAEHYHTQGFAKKAISIYNKIYRIEPDSLEISEKLAELYHIRGSIAESKKHYLQISEAYEEKGFRDKALEVWEIIGNIDPNNADIQLKVAEYYYQDNQKEKASESYIESGLRFSRKNKNEEASKSFLKALEMFPENLIALNGFVKAQTNLGYPEEAVKVLEDLATKDPYNKEISNLLIDSYFETGDTAKAESIIINLVEREPANYEQLVKLVDVYLEENELESTVKILSMASEHLLMDGKPGKLNGYINEVLARNPEQMEALLLQARLYGWQKDELELQKTLERLVEVANINGSVENERYGLSQLLLIVPHNVEYSNRFKEINKQHDFDNEIVGEQLWSNDNNEVPNFESYAKLNEDDDVDNDDSGIEKGFEFETNGFEQSKLENDDVSESAEVVAVVDENAVMVADNQAESVEETDTSNEDSVEASQATVELSLSDKREIEEEIDSIKFYIDQGYVGLAEKSLNGLEEKFGKQSEFAELWELLGGNPKEDANSQNTVEQNVEVQEQVIEPSGVVELSDDSIVVEEYNEVESSTAEVSEESSSVDYEQQTEAVETVDNFQEASEVEEITETNDVGFDEAKETYSVAEELEAKEDEVIEEPEAVTEEFDVEVAETTTVEDEFDAEEIETQVAEEQEFEVAEEPQVTEEVQEFEQESVEQKDDFADFRDDLGLEEVNEKDNEDEYENHYHHAIAYKEMGLLEEAIREFQDAANCVEINDGTRRFFQCCNLLGHCFMEKQMPHLALVWLRRAFETNDLTDLEKRALQYEVASAFEANGEIDEARNEFEQIYAVDVDYRDVGERLENLKRELVTQ